MRAWVNVTSFQLSKTARTKLGTLFLLTTNRIKTPYSLARKNLRNEIFSPLLKAPLGS